MSYFTGPRRKYPVKLSGLPVDVSVNRMYAIVDQNNTIVALCPSRSAGAELVRLANRGRKR